MAFRQKRGRRGLEDRIVLDKNRSMNDNITEVLVNVCQDDETVITADKRVSYLEALVKLIQQSDPEAADDKELRLRLREVMMCLRIPLSSSKDEVRCVTMKVVRYLIKSHGDVTAMSQVNIHHFIIRALDLDLDNKPERIQAMKLARKMLVYGGGVFPVGLVRCLVSIVDRGEVNSKSKSRDELWRSALALLCELSCVNTRLFLDTGLVRILTSALLECSDLPRLTDAVLSALLRLYCDPGVRSSAHLDLSLLVSPYTELPHSDPGDPVTSARLECAATALLSLLRSWPGVLHLTSDQLSSTPLQSLINTLYLPSYQARTSILDLLYKSLNIDVPEWTDEFEVAMKTADPCAGRKEWRLSDGFAAAEGEDILPHLSKSRPNIVESHLALVLSSYLESGLSSALIEVIVTGDTVLSVRAGVLLAQFLHLVSTLLPHEVSSTASALPLLTSHVEVTSQQYSRLKSSKALSAVTGLAKVHGVKKQGCRPSSLFLEQVMEVSGLSRAGGAHFVGDRLTVPAASFTSPDSGAGDLVLIKESGVTTFRDPQSWRWELVMSSLKWPGDNMRRMEDTTCKLYLKKLTDFFLPSSNMFSRLEIEGSKTRYLARVGQTLIDFLISNLSTSVSTVNTQERSSEQDSEDRLDSLIGDIIKCVEELICSNNPHNCVLSPTRLTNTACQFYFLFLGRLSRTEIGRHYLDKHNTLSSLAELLRVRHEIYLKLVITSLDYRQEKWDSRAHILVKGLRESSEQGRVYSTRWLGVLARLSVPNIAVYGVELLVKQLMDESISVSSTALNILDEVCDDKMFLESLVSHSSSLLSQQGSAALSRLGDRGRLLVTRCLGSVYGFSLMTSNSWLSSEMSHWAECFNTRYVLMLENMINDGFSLHQRSEDGTYGRRSGDGQGESVKQVMVPPHLYGQLAATKQGLELLLGENSFWEMMRIVQDVGAGHYRRHCRQEQDWLRVKAAVWAVSSVVSSPSAHKLLEQRGVISSLINIAESCPYLSISGTAYYALGLVATNTAGSEALGGRGWGSIRHSRGEQWPRATDWLQQVDTIRDMSAANRAMSSGGGGSDVDDADPVVRRPSSQPSDTDTITTNKPVSPSKRLGDKISSWFRSSLDNDKSEVKQSRRNSESSGLVNKFRKSFREKRPSFGRQRTTSFGSLPSKENTPVGSLNVTTESVGSTSGANDSRYKRKLSFSKDHTDAGKDEIDCEIVSASPGGDLPGEMFTLDNIKEEPAAETGVRSAPGVEDTAVRAAPCTEDTAVVETLLDTMETMVPGTSPGDNTEEQTVAGAINIERQVTSESVTEDSTGGAVSRDHGSLLGVIRQGTSVSSVSSIGSYSFTDNPGYATRTRKRRPHLSESEDGDHMVSVVSGSRGLDGRSTLPIRGRAGRPVDRALTVPPSSKISTLPRHDKHEPAHYWGLAFPLDTSVLQPSDHSDQLDLVKIGEDIEKMRLGSVATMPVQLSVLYTNSLYSHNSDNCLKCHKLRVRSRPRSSSLTTEAQHSAESHVSEIISDLRRQSCISLFTEDSVMSRDVTSNTDLNTSPNNKKEALAEALNLISNLNNPPRQSKQAEVALVRLQRKWPEIFSDVCFYSDVCHLLSQFQFRSSSRRFIQELFTELNYTELLSEAVSYLNT